MGSPMLPQFLGARPRFVQTSILGFFILFGLLLLQRQHAYRYKQPESMYSDAKYIPAYHDSVARVAKVSMLYGKANGLYQRAIASHERHANIHGYPMHILRNDLAQGYWNKPAYLQSRLLQEMEKDPGDRVDWLMWFDADSIVLNLDVPMDIFLPPMDKKFDKEGFEKYFLTTKDPNGLNTGIFFLRVCEWSVRFMSKTMAYTQYNPKMNLGASVDQRAMELLLNESDFRPHTTFVPKTWINSYVDQAKAGSFLVHFPGLVDRDWHMKVWLSRVEGVDAPKWRMPVAESEYKDTGAFWEQLHQCTELSTKMNETIKDMEHVPKDVEDTVRYFYDSCWYRSDTPEYVARARTNAEAAMNGLEEKVREQRIAEETAYAQKAVEEKAREQKAAEDKAREQKAAEDKAREQKAAEEKAAAEKAREQKAAEDKAREQKAAEEMARVQKAHDEKPHEDEDDGIEEGPEEAEEEEK